MLYVLKCECGSVEFDNKRHCKECGNKFRNKYNHVKEYNDLVHFRMLQKKDNEVIYVPDSGVNNDKSLHKPLYVLTCKCGSIHFDDKRRCLNCGHKFNNSSFARSYSCVRYDWLAKFNDNYSYYYDVENGKHISNFNLANSLRRSDANKKDQDKKAKGERRLERKLQAFKEGKFNPDPRQEARLRDYEARKILDNKRKGKE